MKKFIKKLAKKTEGFTLVELVVVIAILGILAGVAVPAYSGYIEKAKEAGDETVLGAVLTAAQACNAENGAVTEVVVTDGTNESVKITGDGVTAQEIIDTDDFELYFTGAIGGDVKIDLESKKYAGKTITWKNGDWTAA